VWFDDMCSMAPLQHETSRQNKGIFTGLTKCFDTTNRVGKA